MSALASSPLLEHLVSQGASSAAARLGALPPPSVPADPFTVPLSAVTLVDGQSSAQAFIRAMRELPTESTVGADLEWRPDVRGQPSHRPSLLQLATVDDVWLLDLESSIGSEVLDAGFPDEKTAKSPLRR